MENVFIYSVTGNIGAGKSSMLRDLKQCFANRYQLLKVNLYPIMIEKGQSIDSTKHVVVIFSKHWEQNLDAFFAQFYQNPKKHAIPLLRRMILYFYQMTEVIEFIVNHLNQVWFEPFQNKIIIITKFSPIDIEFFLNATNEYLAQSNTAKIVQTLASQLLNEWPWSNENNKLYYMNTSEKICEKQICLRNRIKEAQFLKQHPSYFSYFASNLYRFFNIPDYQYSHYKRVTGSKEEIFYQLFQEAINIEDDEEEELILVV